MDQASWTLYTLLLPAQPNGDAGSQRPEDAAGCHVVPCPVRAGHLEETCSPTEPYTPPARSDALGFAGLLGPCLFHTPCHHPSQDPLPLQSGVTVPSRTQPLFSSTQLILLPRLSQHLENL